MNTFKVFLKRYAILLFFPLAYLLSWGRSSSRRRTAASCRMDLPWQR